jgi:hypothetical protein
MATLTSQVTQLLDDAEKEIIITRPGALRVVDGDQPRVLEFRVVHPPTVARRARRHRR